MYKLYRSILALVFLLTLAYTATSWLLTLYPAYGIQIGGNLTEAVVVNEATQNIAESSSETIVEATVRFSPKCEIQATRSCSEVATNIELPADVASETPPGGKVPVTYLPGYPEYAVYGIVKNKLFDADTVKVSLIIAAIAALMLWMARSRDTLEAFRQANGAIPFVIGAIAALVVMVGCMHMTIHLLRWEWGMTYAKRVSPSKITEVYIEDGDYYAKYPVVVEDGLGFWRSRLFDVSEIDDVQKMKVGRKFDVVFIDGRPAYNRPDWVEAIHAPKRKLWMALWAIASAGALGLVLQSIYWARGGPSSQSLFGSGMRTA